MSLLRYGFTKTPLGAPKGPSPGKPSSPVKTPSVSSSSDHAPLKATGPELNSKRPRVVDDDEEEEEDVMIVDAAPTSTAAVAAPVEAPKASAAAPFSKVTPAKRPTTATVTTDKKKPAKLKKRIESDDDPEEDDEEASAASASSTSSEASESEADSEEEEEEEEEARAPKAKAKQAKKPAAAPRSGSKPWSSGAGGAASSASKSPAPSEDGGGGGKAGVLMIGEHEHNRLPWLVAPLDLNKRAPDHADYDGTTLYVPDGYLSGVQRFHDPEKAARKITPAMVDWWHFYSRLFDCVLAFKVGKFFEFYHRCADVVVRVCGLVYMKGDVAHCGFPEKAWAKNCFALLQAGYRVARVEQTETPAGREERLQTKSAGNVRRELCQIHSPGTMTLTVRDQPIEPGTRVHLMSVAQKPSGAWAMCVVNPTTGTFRCAEFESDAGLVELRSVLALECPAELVYTDVSAELQAVLNAQRGVLYTRPPRSFKGTLCLDPYELPIPAKQWVADQSPLICEAMGMCVAVLARCLVDEELVSMGLFSQYPKIKTARQTHMVLDAQALRHLDVLSNSIDGSTKGSLLGFVDHTQSPFGARLLRDWVTRPLVQVEQIVARQRAVEELITRLDDFKDLKLSLKQCPDLERCLARIHALGSAKKASAPDSRAVVYDAEAFSKSKVETLAQTVQGIFALEQSAARLRPMSSPLLRGLVAGLTSDALVAALDDLKKNVDFKTARATGVFEPKPGLSVEYDECLAIKSQVLAELDAVLKQAKADLRTQATFWNTTGVGKDRFQIEVSESVQVPSGWTLASKKKGYRRYSTSRVKDLVAKLDKAEAQLVLAGKNISRQVFARFAQARDVWIGACTAAAELDCLLSLAKVSSCNTDESPWSLPQFVSGSPRIEIEQGRHPCVAAVMESQGKRRFIPNDSFIGGERGSCMLLTGPNMGGKSTLLRQLCLCTILAQIGCRVPARSMKLTPADRVFTRIGASDRIMEKQSTFFVELSETATILNRATRDSLVILDELGRGTSTFDGTSIAHAVVDKLCEIGSRTVFATHYHSLVREVGPTQGVQLGHMTCLADEGDDVTFLYQLAPGASNRSLGLNVAKLARIPESVVQRANEMSILFEDAFFKSMATALVNEAEMLLACNDTDALRELARRAGTMVD